MDKLKRKIEGEGDIREKEEGRRWSKKKKKKAQAKPRCQRSKEETEKCTQR